MSDGAALKLEIETLRKHRAQFDTTMIKTVNRMNAERANDIEVLQDQLDEISEMIPDLEDNRSTVGVARKLRSILGMPPKPTGDI